MTDSLCLGIFLPLERTQYQKVKEIMRQRKDGEVGNKETCLRLHPPITDWQWRICMAELLPFLPTGFPSATSSFPTVPLGRSSGPHLTRSIQSLCFYLFPDLIRKSLLSCHFFFLWHLLLNTSNHVRTGFSQKTSQEGLGNFPCLLCHLSSSLIQLHL